MAWQQDPYYRQQPPPPGYGQPPDPYWQQPPPPAQQQWQQPYPPQVRQPEYRGPARTAHSIHYWIWVGWWWEPACWLGRMLLWLIPPLGMWRSARHGRKMREARQRRGYR